MKRFLVIGLALGALLLLLVVLWRRSSSVPATAMLPDATSETPAMTDASPNEARTDLKPERAPAETGSVGEFPNPEYERRVRSFNETANIPLAFYGQVVDQDTNPLPSVQIELIVAEEYMTPDLRPTGTWTNLQRQTGTDGRFEVTGLKGHRVTVVGLAKDGYEPEMGIQRRYGEYAAETGGFDNPVVFKMWSTNIHEALVAGEKSFGVIPDGRHYGIDLIKGTIAEGHEGDLVVWIKRPESVKWGQRYDWSCEVAVPGGGLLESQSQAMFTAPESGYTNVFTHQEDAGQHGWGGGFERKRFFVRLRTGQMYGRISVDLYADNRGKQPAKIRLTYAINPSGSRLLR